MILRKFPLYVRLPLRIDRLRERVRLRDLIGYAAATLFLLCLLGLVLVVLIEAA